MFILLLFYIPATVVLIEYSYVCMLSCMWLCNSMDVAHQAPLAMELSKQECWSRLPFPTPEDPPNPANEPTSLVAAALARHVLYHCTTWETTYRILRWPSVFPTLWVRDLQSLYFWNHPPNFPGHFQIFQLEFNEVNSANQFHLEG